MKRKASASPSLPKRREAPDGSPPGSLSVGRVEATFVKAFHGPLPPPETLAGYEQACPGAAERILRMAENQAGHRQEQETVHQDLARLIVAAEVSSERRGQWLAFSLAVLISGGGVYLLSIGKEVTGFVALMTPLAAMAGVFIYAKKRRSRLADEVTGED